MPMTLPLQSQIFAAPALNVVASAWGSGPYKRLEPINTNQVVDHPQLLSHQQFPCRMLPGRGTKFTGGVCLFDRIDPMDVNQYAIGDCWFLSALSAIAEYPGAIKQLYRKTQDLDNKPYPNQLSE